MHISRIKTTCIKQRQGNPSAVLIHFGFSTIFTSKAIADLPEIYVVKSTVELQEFW